MNAALFILGCANLVFCGVTGAWWLDDRRSIDAAMCVGCGTAGVFTLVRFL